MASTGVKSGKDHLSLTRGLSGIGEPLFMLTSPGRPNMPTKSAALNTAPCLGRHIAAENLAAAAGRPLESNSFSFSTVPEPARLELSPAIGSRTLSPAPVATSPTTSSMAQRGPTSVAIPMQNGIILSRALDLASMYRRQIMELYTCADATDGPALAPGQPMAVKPAYSDLPASILACDPSPDSMSSWIKAVAKAQCKAWQEASLKLHYLQQQDTWHVPPPPTPQVMVGPQGPAGSS